jgi:L-lactate dehydrogenase (cytochrome)
VAGAEFTVDEVRAAALRRWPASVRGYVEGGADGEVSLRRNRQAYDDYALMPFALRDTSDADTGTCLLGQPVSAPLALGPTADNRMMHAAGEPAVARAARTAGIPYTLSTLASTSIEDLARAVPGELWFQLYILEDRELTRDLLDRAQRSGYRALVVTVDAPVTGLRVRDRRRALVAQLFSLARHPAWATRTLAGRKGSYANFPGPRGRDSSGAVNFQFDSAISWDHLAWVRQLWTGPVVVKGLLRADDAVRAADAGADAVVLSNHGGRQLDRTLAPVHALPEVVDALAGRIEVLVDSGVRSGGDIAIALALGADGVLIGRPYLYGLAAGGEHGVGRVIEMLRSQLCRTMQLLGVSTIEELRREGRGLIRVDGPPRMSEPAVL